MPIPEFVGTPVPYWLPPGVHGCTVAEVEDRFLFNQTRRRVWERFLTVLRRLHDFGISFDEIFVDGSFVTGRSEPGDVDGFAYIPEDRMMRILDDTPDYTTLRTILNEQIARRLFGADLFIVGSTDEVDRKRRTFTRGVDGNGLPRPDPFRDPDALTVPDEKGILRVDGRDFFQSL